jgi:serine/threonine-protein phosphatase 2A activator
MYNAEVLSKFPVVQHFPFGSLFSWEQDINASPQTQSVHTMSQPTGSSRSAGAQMVRPPPAGGTNAPWAVPAHGAGIAQTITPWTQAPTGPPQPGMPPTRPPWASKSRANPGGQASLQDTQHRNLPC